MIYKKFRSVTDYKILSELWAKCKHDSILGYQEFINKTEHL